MLFAPVSSSEFVSDAKGYQRECGPRLVRLCLSTPRCVKSLASHAGISKRSQTFLEIQRVTDNPGRITHPIGVNPKGVMIAPTIRFFALDRDQNRKEKPAAF
jgi:hypothetical protein